jgi:peptide/nickel transport system permease protein
MWAYLLKRALLMIPTLIGITMVGFALIHLAPGDPRAATGDVAFTGQFNREATESFRKSMGLDRPLPERYAKWLLRIATLDFGTSSYDHRPVIDKIAESLPTTLLLSGLALLLAYLVALALGILSAVKQGSLLDHSVTLGLFTLWSLPSFWVAILLVLFLGGGHYLDLFPAQGLHSAGSEHLGALARLADLAWHLVLPVFCLSYASFASLSRYVRNAMLEVIRQDYVRTARAKGLPERAVILKHALRNALIPVVTLLGVSLPQLIGGSVIIEQIFNIPGMGRLSFQALATRDFNTILAVTTLSALLTVGGVLLSDLAYSFVDPRIRAAR